MCTTAFYKPQNLAQAMMEFESSSFGARSNAFVKGVRVQAIHTNYRKSIKGTAGQSARQHKFHYDELNRTVSVEEYFKISVYLFFFLENLS